QLGRLIFVVADHQCKPRLRGIAGARRERQRQNGDKPHYRTWKLSHGASSPKRNPPKRHCLARIEPSNELESCRTPRCRRTNDQFCTYRRSERVQQLGWQGTKEQSARGACARSGLPTWAPATRQIEKCFNKR